MSRAAELRRRAGLRDLLATFEDDVQHSVAQFVGRSHASSDLLATVVIASATMSSRSGASLDLLTLLANPPTTVASGGGAAHGSAVPQSSSARGLLKPLLHVPLADMHLALRSPRRRLRHCAWLLFPPASPCAPSGPGRSGAAPLAQYVPELLPP